jgi:hypothetical protein
MVFSDELIEKVWQKARATSKLSSETWRQDECGAWMRRDHYGLDRSEFSWKIENISLGGPDTLENLRPFHRANVYDHANRRATCHITADLAGVSAVEQVVSEPRNRKA